MPAAAETRLALWRRLRQLTADMKTAAQAQDWDRLLAAAAQRREIENALRAFGETPPTAEDAECAALIRAVIADDEVIRGLVGACMDDIRKWLGDNRRERTVRSAYGSPP